MKINLFLNVTFNFTLDFITCHTQHQHDATHAKYNRLTNISTSHRYITYIIIVTLICQLTKGLQRSYVFGCHDIA